MRLIEALSIVKAGRLATGPSFRTLLATGFTPLHLETFLRARLCERAPTRRNSLEQGLFGDLAGTLENPGSVDAMAAVIEWEDLDPRLGVRTLGGWTAEALPDIVQSAQRRIERISAAVRGLAAPVVIALPSLPFPPVAYSSPQALSRLESELRGALYEFVADVGTIARVVNPSELDLTSPVGARFDLQAAIASGFPYTLEHADHLAVLLAALLLPKVPAKGLISDLDDTLWAGTSGEDGIQGLRWNLDGHAQMHGLYQQFLASLASAGTLIGVASKNDPALVDAIFAERQDLLLPAQDVFPIVAHWGPKSESVKSILESWNIAAADVVFVDDSPMEVAEVQAAFPDMECVVFPKASYPEFWALLRHLREKFGKNNVLAEDKLRLRTLRAAGEFRREFEEGSAPEQLLRDAQAELDVHWDKRPDARAFELLNKTNQFNLNGNRLTEGEWNALLADPDSFVLKLAYRDRFGPLGSIAVAAGRCRDGEVWVQHWVMSCRAFSRRIEHHALKLLFDNFSTDDIRLAFKPTPRNGPTQSFLESFLGPIGHAAPRITREQFTRACPALYHSLKFQPAMPLVEAQ